MSISEFDCRDEAESREQIPFDHRHTLQFSALTTHTKRRTTPAYYWYTMKIARIYLPACSLVGGNGIHCLMSHRLLLTLLEQKTIPAC